MPTIILHSMIACVITLGWCLMFTLPRRYIPSCLLMTFVGFALKGVLDSLAIHLMISTFFAAMTTSFIGVYFAKRYKITPKALIIPSIVCLMPGIPAYQAMIGLVQLGYFGFNLTLFTTMMTQFFAAIFVISALVLGLSIPSLLFYREKPIV